MLEKLKEQPLKLIIFLIIFLSIGFISYKILGADSAIEEFCEAQIENMTGLDIDISPKKQ